MEYIAEIKHCPLTDNDINYIADKINEKNDTGIYLRKYTLCCKCGKYREYEIYVATTDWKQYFCKECYENRLKDMQELGYTIIHK